MPLNDTINYRNGTLCVESVPLSQIAEQFGTPCYVYSRNHIEQNWLAYDAAFGKAPHQICYAVKANSNLAILNLLARLGSGFDIVSGGELQRVLAAGGDPAKTVFSGVAKTSDEIEQALRNRIGCINIESPAELDRIAEIAAGLGTRAPVSFRVNPDVDPKTHPYISTGLKENKFGVAFDEARQLYNRAASMNVIDVIGIDCHIGSQLTQIDPFGDALDRLISLIDQLEDDGIRIDHIDMGGGLGIRYQNEIIPPLTDFAALLTEKLNGRQIKLIVEPGRSIVGNSAVMLTEVEYLKHTPTKNFAIVDGGMNDLIRPSLYSAWQKIVNVKESPAAESLLYDIVGPICETGDFLGKDRELKVAQGDLLAVLSAGAYGFTMSSNYNTRPRPCEIMVDNDQVHLIRRRENIEQLYADEQIVE